MFDNFPVSIVRAVLISSVLVCVSLAQNAQPPAVPLYLDPAQPVAARVDDLISRMTLEEKASQLVNQARAIPRLQVPAIRLVERSLARSRECRDGDSFPGAHWTGGNF